MELAEYQKLASRTLPNLGSQAANGAHMALGVMTEILELLGATDQVNEMEEIGDISWYMANDCNVYGLDFAALWEHGVCSEEDFEDIHDYLDLHKREFAYGKEVDREKLFSLLSTLMGALKAYVPDIEEYKICLEKNIAKLKVRFPDKFDADKAINRDLKAERKELES